MMTSNAFVYVVFANLLYLVKPNKGGNGGEFSFMHFPETLLRNESVLELDGLKISLSKHSRCG